jgi:deferrochelatase/peroxidase EfeB
MRYRNTMSGADDERQASDQLQSMSGSGDAADEDPTMPSRRRFFATAAGAAAVTALGPGAAALAAPARDAVTFWGRNQGGIATAQQSYAYVAAFDLTTAKRDELIALLRTWTAAAARMADGQTAVALGDDPAAEPHDSGEALGLPPRRLTLTFGFGPSLFRQDGVDRYGLAPRRPEALIDLPRFNGDQLVPERTGGDLCIQACADEPQIAFHAVRQLARLTYSAAKMRWAQAGFLPINNQQETPRNLMGFKDGTLNPPLSSAPLLERLVWVGEEGDWMQHGSYMVVRPIRIALEHWDRMKLGFQEQVVGRHKRSGAPLGSRHEHDPLDLDASDADGNPRIPENSHVRLAAPAANDGAQVLRRGYSYDNGLSFTAERWPPWRQGMEFDAGLLFICFQRDPRTGFVKIFDKMSKFDMMNQFVTHVGGGLFACPPGAASGGFIGQSLLEGA